MNNGLQLLTNYGDELGLCMSGLQSPAFASQLSVVSRNQVNPISPNYKANTILAKLDSSLGFLSVAVSSVAYLAIHAIAVIFLAPIALLDADAARFFKVQARRCSVDLDAILVGIGGTFSPDYGSHLVWENVKKLGSEMFDITLKHAANAAIEASNQGHLNDVLTNYGLTAVHMADLQSAIARTDYLRIKEIIRRSLFVNAQFQAELRSGLRKLDFNPAEIQTIETDLRQFHFERIITMVQPRLNELRQDLNRRANGLF